MDGFVSPLNIPRWHSSAVCLFAAVLVGCASAKVGHYVVPGETLNPGGQYYIVFAAGDEHALHEMLRESMTSHGLDVVSGFEDRMPATVQYRVEYGSRWQWDITWYLIDFNIRIYDAATGLLVASANSMRTSLKRLEPGQVVAETLAQLYGDSHD